MWCCSVKSVVVSGENGQVSPVFQQKSCTCCLSEWPLAWPSVCKKVLGFVFQRYVQNASGSDFSAEVQSANACVLSSATVPLGPGSSSAGVTLCTGNNPQLSSSGFGWLHQTPSCFCTSHPHCKYTGWLIKKKCRTAPKCRRGKISPPRLSAHTSCLWDRSFQW